MKTSIIPEVLAQSIPETHCDNHRDGCSSLVSGPGFWNKGVDIWASAIANTISGLILAGIVGVAYFLKLKIDLGHRENLQRQEWRLNKQIKAEEQQRERQNKRSRLETERSDLSRRMRETEELETIIPYGQRITPG